MYHTSRSRKGRKYNFFLDEINSLDYLLNSDTLANRRPQVYNTLCIIIGRASYVIGVDADLSDVADLSDADLSDLDPYVMHNKYKNATGNVKILYAVSIH